VVKHARREDTGGRGMELVERFAEAWGTDVSAAGKGVWFRLRLDRPTVHDPGTGPRPVSPR
jgi:hypothetical protein